MKITQCFRCLFCHPHIIDQNIFLNKKQNKDPKAKARPLKEITKDITTQSCHQKKRKRRKKRQRLQMIH